MMDYERMVNEWIMDPQVDPMAIQLVDCDHCDHICWVRFSEVWPSRIASVAIRCGQQGPWPWKIGQHYHWTSHDKSQLAKLIDLRSGYGSIPMKIPFLMGWTSILTQLFWCEQKRGTKLVLTHHLSGSPRILSRWVNGFVCWAQPLAFWRPAVWNIGYTMIGWWENFNRKVLYLMVKTMVSCRFSLKPIVTNPMKDTQLDTPEITMELSSLSDWKIWTIWNVSMGIYRPFGNVGEVILIQTW